MSDQKTVFTVVVEAFNLARKALDDVLEEHLFSHRDFPTVFKTLQSCPVQGIEPITKGIFGAMAKEDISPVYDENIAHMFSSVIEFQMQQYFAQQQRQAELANRLAHGTAGHG